LFIGFVLIRLQVGDKWPAWWLQVADVPFIAVALLFGGVSFYESIWGNASGSRARMPALGVGILLGVFFIALVAFNFWPLFL